MRRAGGERPRGQNKVARLTSGKQTVTLSTFLNTSNVRAFMAEADSPFKSNIAIASHLDYYVVNQKRRAKANSVRRETTRPSSIIPSFTVSIIHAPNNVWIVRLRFGNLLGETIYHGVPRRSGQIIEIG